MEDQSPLPLGNERKKPAWLAKLEEESWQAELLVSGAAIVGAFQLPGLLSRLDDYVLYTVNREAMPFWYFLHSFMSLFVVAVIATFLLHFVLRTLWIAMIGFNSVYPQGFQPSERYSEDYQQKLYKEFGDITGYIQRLDQTCSSILAIGFSVVFTASGWGLVLTLFGLLLYWARDYIPNAIVLWVGGILYAVVILSSAFSMLMGSKKFRERDWVKQYHFPFATAISKVMFNLGYRPTNIVFNLLYSRSGEKSGRSFVIPILVSIGIGFLVPNLNQKGSYYIDSLYQRLGADSTQISPLAYQPQALDEQIYLPVIPSMEVQDRTLLRVFIPLPNREYFELMKQCNVAEIDRNLDRGAARMAKRQRLLACGREYIQIELNGKSITDFELFRHYYGPQEQFGLEAHITYPNYRPGKNMLSVITNYLNEEGAPRVTYIPFYFVPKETGREEPR